MKSLRNIRLISLLLCLVGLHNSNVLFADQPGLQAIPDHIREYCERNAPQAAQSSDCLREHKQHYDQVVDYMRQLFANRPQGQVLHGPADYLRQCRLRFSTFGHLWENHCQNVPIFLGNSLYPYDQNAARQFDGPDFIYNYCLANTRDGGSINRCLSNESQLYHSTEAYLRREISNEASRDTIFKDCIDRHANQGMSWIEHCARTEASYRRMFP